MEMYTCDKLYFLSTVHCSVGKYFDQSKDLCVMCPLGEYQPHAGSLKCLACPANTSTETTGTTNAQNCKGRTNQLIYKPQCNIVTVFTTVMPLKLYWQYVSLCFVALAYFVMHFLFVVH